MTVRKIYATIGVMPNHKLEISPEYQQDLGEALEPLCTMGTLRKIYEVARDSRCIGPTGPIRILKIEDTMYDASLRVTHSRGRYSTSLSMVSSALRFTFREYGMSRIVSGTPFSIGLSPEDYVDTSYPNAFTAPLYAKQKTSDRLSIHASAIDQIRTLGALPAAELYQPNEPRTLGSGLDEIRDFANQLIDIDVPRVIHR